MRKLLNSELYDGMYVSLSPNDFISYENNDSIYQIIIEDGINYYTKPNSNWKHNGEYVKDNWYETSETIKLNREDKLNKLINLDI